MKEPGIYLFSDVKNKERIVKTMVALANKQGGTIFIGVSENLEILGLKEVETIENDIHNIVKEKTTPILPYISKMVTSNEKHVLVISVWEGPRKPYLYDLDAYVFENNELKTADNKLINGLFDDRKAHDCSWERNLVYEASIEDLDLDEVKGIALNANIEYSDEVDFLRRQGLLIGDVPTNAAIVLFGKYPSKFLPQTRIRMSVYSGIEENRKLVQVHIFEGNLFSNLRDIKTKCEDIYGKNLRITGYDRTNDNVLPETAFREAILNAMVHRDYSVYNSFLNIIINNNELQIKNSGNLIKGITLDSLRKEHLSILRNQDLANICYLSGFIEMAGSGTLRIIEECNRTGLIVSWTSGEDIIGISIKGLKHKESVKHNYKLSSNDSIQKVYDNIIEYIRKHPGCKVKDVQECINKSVPTTKRYLQSLKEYSIISYKGSLQTGGYYVED